MDIVYSPAELVPVASALLLMLLCTHQALEVDSTEEIEDNYCSELERLRDQPQSSTLDAMHVTRAALHSFRLCSCVHLLGDDLGFWVKPRSTTWFSRFLLEQYEEDRWVEMFRMTKASVFAFSDLLRPAVLRRDTRYRLAIPVIVRVAYTLFKLTHGASLLVCSEMFAVGRSSVSMILRQVVNAVNVVMRGEISWPRGQELLHVEAGFRQLCGLLGAVGAIDGTHIAISKPKYCPADYFYFKSGGYTLNCQAVVDSQKRFLDLFLGMPGSTNDARVLQRSSLYEKGSRQTLWDAGVSFQEFSPYLLGDAGYPLMSWLMVPHHELRGLTLVDSLFNRKQKRGRCVVENAFGMLKQTFRELLVKSELHVTFLPDVITACAIMHNMLLRQSGADVERLLNVLRTEAGADDEVVDDAAVPLPAETDVDDNPRLEGERKRRQLGVHLSMQRGQPL